jgi:hypothetical protein
MHLASSLDYSLEQHHCWLAGLMTINVAAHPVGQSHHHSPTLVPSSASATTTALPILCLLDWSAPKCREQLVQVPAPRFASANFLAASSAEEYSSLDNEEGEGEGGWRRKGIANDDDRDRGFLLGEGQGMQQSGEINQSYNQSLLSNIKSIQSIDLLCSSGFFTPIVSKPFQRVTAAAATSSSTSSSSSSATTTTATTSPTTQKTTTTRTAAASTSRAFPRSEDLSAAGSKTVGGCSFYFLKNAEKYCMYWQHSL